MKKRGLGRGLDALLGNPEAPAKREATRMLPIDVIQRGRFQPRKNFDPERLQELADSISAQGLIQPIIVRTVAEGAYEILAGERRWRAAQLAGLQEVPVVVQQVNDQAAMAIALIENIQREDLNPLEEAQALQRLLQEFGMTHQQVADSVGRSRAAVSNLLRLLDCHDAVKELVNAGSLDMGHARALLALPLDLQGGAAQTVVNKDLSVRATEALVKKLLQGPAKPAKLPAVDADVLQLQESVSERLGARVLIRHSQKGNGKIEIHYSSLDELEGVLSHLQ